MVNLVALMSSDTKNWKAVASLFNSTKWDNVYLVCNDLAYSNIDVASVHKLKFDESNPIVSIGALTKFFKNEIKDFEVCVNLSSGTGLEHMTLVSALLKSGLGLRFVYSQDGEVKEFELLDEKYIPEENIDAVINDEFL